MKTINSRNIHRYLSVIIGVQLLFWTLSGLIFSWNPIQKVRGEDLIQNREPVDLTSFELIGPNELVEKNRSQFAESVVAGVELRSLLDQPVYEVTYRNGEAASSKIYDAIDGELLSPISQEMARQIAEADFSPDVKANAVELISEVGSSHSEYRGKELPAYRVTMDHPTGTVIYVSAERGVVTTRRNFRWRVFDFFWMLHTMDYQGRDNFNSWLLRAMSIFGVTTVLSGYWLWWRTSRIRRNRIRKKMKTGD